jgi:hypothetical protein
MAAEARVWLGIGITFIELHTRKQHTSYNPIEHTRDTHEQEEEKRYNG